MHILPYDTGQHAEFLAFITRLNALPEHHIGYFGVTAEDIIASLKDISVPLSEGFLLAYDHEQLLGIMGLDADEELGRAWLHGPILEAQAAINLADQLYQQLIPKIPPAIYEHELFCDTRNQTCRDFAERNHFSLHSDVDVLYFTRNLLPTVSSQSLSEIDPAHYAAFYELHDRLFPRSYASAKNLIEERDQHKKIFVALENGELLGYIAAKVEPETASGYTDFVGVAEGARQRGIGRILLSAAMQWMFSWPEIQRCDLTVNSNNTAARNLYLSLGFQYERSLCAYRKSV